jgi:CSLREA domain-containing protein
MKNVIRFSLIVLIFVAGALGLSASTSIAESIGAGSLLKNVFSSKNVGSKPTNETKVLDTSTPEPADKLLIPAATLTVTTTADTNDGVCDAICSLREAVAAAAPGDSIEFGSPLFDSAQTINLNGQIAINKNLTITGRGAALTILRNVAPANAKSRVFSVSGTSTTVTLSKMTVSGGRIDRFDPDANCGNESCGGGIQNSGNLTLNEMFFTDNRVANNDLFGLRYGGAVSTSQSSILTVIGSTFTGNSVSGPFQNYGGAIYSAGTLIIANSTITDNTLTLTGNGNNYGGGIVREGGTAAIFNSTIANNTLNGSSGGDFCTGGGIFQSSNFFGDVKALNVIVANNSVSNCQNFGTDFGGTLTSLGNNLLGSTNGTTINGTTTGNILNQNPLLAPLGNYGGTVPTRPLTNSSPAINGGNNCVTNQSCGTGNNPPVAIANDQRGASRVGNADIGAFEVNNSQNGGNFRTTLPSGRQTIAYSYTLIENVGAFTTSNISSGALPNGLPLQLSGSMLRIAGTPIVSGTFNFTLTASDGTNSFAADYALLLEPENVPPDTTIISSPPSLSNNPNPTFTFTGSDTTTSPANLTYECSLDNSPFTACPSPQTYNGVADGLRTFAVRAKDEAGNVDPTPSTYTWTIETVPPALPIISYPSINSIIFINQPTFTGTAEANSTVRVFLNNALIGTTSADGAGNWSQAAAGTLADGLYTVKATATDTAGNVSPEASNFFRIATVAPTLGDYSNGTVNLAGNTTFTPTAASTGAQYTTATTTSDFKGEIEADPVNGNIRVTNAYPAGTYNVTVKAVNPFGIVTKNFTMTVQTVAGCNSFDTTAFSAPVTYPANANPTAVTVGDFNGDGRQDIVTANQNIGIVAVMLRNAANNGFEAPVSITTDLQPGNLAVGDINGDGRQDIVTSNFQSHSVSVILRNVTNTGFDAALNYPLNPFQAPGRQPFDVAVGDINGDGLQDIATANYNGGGISVLVRNAANNGFEPFVDYTAVSLARSVVFGDFNGDGRQDLAVANQGAGISIFLRNAANNNFDPRIDYGSENQPSDLTVGDFNGDGKQDLAVGHRGVGIISVFLRNAANTDFEPRANYTVANWSNSLVTGDLNNDGKQDIAFNVPDAGSIQVLVRNGANNGFETPVTFGNINPWGISIGDFNGDNRQDLVGANLNTSSVTVIQRQCPAETTTTVTSSANPSVFGQQVTFTATVTPNPNVGTPTGTVTFLDGATAICSNVALNAGQAQCQTSTLTVGNHTISAAYSGATGFGSSTGNLDTNPQIVNRADTTVTITNAGVLSTTPTTVGQSYDVRWSVAVNSPGIGTPTGNVTVSDGTDSCSANITAGQCNLTSTTAGLKTITVTYSGDTNFNGDSETTTHQVDCSSSRIVTNTNDNGAGSLRQAVADVCAGGTITFSSFFNTARTITLTSGDILIEKSLTITGTGANLLTISGNNASRIFRFINVPSAAISGMTITHGNTDNGGGIFSFGSNLSITNCVVSGNRATGNSGGIYNINGTVDVINSTVSGNTSLSAGGGITNGASPAVLNVTNSTISGNSAASGGGIFTNSSVTIRSSTITNNFATSEGGGISNFTNEAVSLGNTIVAGNNAPSAPDFRDTLTSLGYNLIGNANGAIITGDTTGNILNQNARLLPLGNYGGTTQTHALSPDSPAINAGTSTNAPANDQRGRARVGNVDIGAFEAPANLIVTNTNDSGAGSLRNAIQTANSTAADESISFDIPANDAGCANGVCTITLTSGQLSIANNGSLMVVGSGADKIIVSGNNASRVMQIQTGGNALISGLTIANGNEPTLCGGGIDSQNSASLTVISSVIRNNSVSNASCGSGGGINSSSGVLNLIGSTVYNNTASQNGGGIHLSTGRANIVNSTISGNTANNGSGGGGGGITNFTGTINITNSTITGNTGNNGAGIRINGGTYTIRNSIIANSNGLDCNNGGTLNIEYSLVEDGSCGVTNGVNNNLTGDPNLIPLGFYGGSTPTHGLMSNSIALNAGNNCVTNQNCTTFNPLFSAATDQRGASRVGNVDIGAFEVNNSANGGNYRVILPFGRQNFAYNYLLSQDSGSFTYNVIGGSLPNGLGILNNFVPNAVVSLNGTPSQSGIFNFSVAASDGANSNITDYSVDILAPTAAAVTIGGRILSGKIGVMNATVTLTDSEGNSRTARTNPFGFYRFNGVPAGQTCIVSVSAKRFEFAPQVVIPYDNIADLDFIALARR